jgi:hypothetical protein
MGTPSGKAVADAAGIAVGKGEGVGIKVSVARAAGEQAANPPRMPMVPTFKASLREIFFVMGIPPGSKMEFTYFYRLSYYFINFLIRLVSGYRNLKFTYLCGTL